MKRTAAILILLTAATAATAADYLERAVYWCHQNGHTEATLLGSEVLNMAKGKGALSYIVFQAESWKFAGPSKATLTALDGPTVDAWIDGYKKGLEADFEDWSDKLKAIAKLMRDQINVIRVSHSQPAYSVAEWKAMIKAEM